MELDEGATPTAAWSGRIAPCGFRAGQGPVDAHAAHGAIDAHAALPRRSDLPRIAHATKCFGRSEGRFTLQPAWVVVINAPIFAAI